MRTTHWVMVAALAAGLWGCAEDTTGDDADPGGDAASTDGAAGGDAAASDAAAGDAASAADARVPDLGVMDPPADAGLAADAADLLDAALPDADLPDAALPDAGACIWQPPPEPDCSPAALGHGGGAPVAFQQVSRGPFEEPSWDTDVVHLADNCQMPVEVFGTVILTSDAEFFELQRCFGDAEPEPTGVDWGTWRLAIYPVNESPDWSLLWVVEDAGTLTVGAELPAYCGGPAPPPSMLAVLVPAGDAEVAEQLAGCRTGDGLACCACEVVCDPEPRRTNCECPP
jgi:hypothetical protein